MNNRVVERQLFERYKETPSKEIRNEIMDQYIHIAQIAAKRFSGRGIDYDDLYQVACIGLLYAVERFDYTRGVKFITFAVPTITGEIKKYFRDKGNFIRVPRRLYEIFSKADKIRVANETEEHYGTKDAVMPQVMSIEAEILGEDMRFENILGQTDEGFLIVEDKDFVDNCMKRLDETESRFIRKRYYEEKSQKQIAIEFGVSQMYVSRLERRLLKKLRDMYFKDAV